MIDNYPFSPIARILYLRNLKNINSYKFEQELSKHAIFIPDRSAFYRMLISQPKLEEGFELLPYSEEAFKEILDEENVPIDELPIDEFDYLNTEVFRLIDDQSGFVLTEKPEKDDLIEKFLHGNVAIKPISEVTPEAGKFISEQSDSIGEEMITETLAKVYQRQGLYFEAMKSYEKLILKFPEKNSYFAEQIENIKKLISKES
jgi:tetratricopeptide (TPR) repeat protein